MKISIYFNTELTHCTVEADGIEHWGDVLMLLGKIVGGVIKLVGFASTYRM